MSTIGELPEVQALDSRRELIRIPNELDVPLTPRVRRLIDTAEFRRLSQISQLGLVAHVYPAARHTRFEHVLGVYRMSLLYLRQLQHDERFAESVTPQRAAVLIVSALLHDIGHWPFCHPIEDIMLPDVPRHEEFAQCFIRQGEVADVLRSDWNIEPDDVLNLLSGNTSSLADRILKSVLSSPIDVDKMDYLVRDSLHAGVPYGQNFDQQRLVGSLCLNEAGDGLAITEKGRTAAEMMVFARYVMFSEVYWHHAVRSATAMLQRAFFEIHKSVDLSSLFVMTETQMIGALREAATDGPAARLLDGLFGNQRRLYKRLAQFSFFQQRDLYEKLAGRPFPWLASCANRAAQLLNERHKIDVSNHELLFDAPPAKREVEFNIEVFFSKENCYRKLGDVSPVVKTLALEQFDDYVKRVRVFAHPRLIEKLRSVDDVPELINIAADEVSG